MEHNLYTNLAARSKKQKTNLWPSELRSLGNLLEQETWNFDLDELVQAYCFELKSVLEKSTIEEMIQSLFKLEGHLEQLASKYNAFEDWPNLNEFYQHLSPVLLQSVLEVNKNEGNETPVLKGLMEGLRISLEEEIHIWQEKI